MREYRIGREMPVQWRLYWPILRRSTGMSHVCDDCHDANVSCMSYMCTEVNMCAEADADTNKELSSIRAC